MTSLNNNQKRAIKLSRASNMAVGSPATIKALARRGLCEPDGYLTPEGQEVKDELLAIRALELEADKDEDIILR